MSKKSKNSLLSGQGPASLATLAKRDLEERRYSMNSPGEDVYPLSSELEPFVYPDFEPFHEGDANNVNLANQQILNKGLFESPQVSNEYFSARNLIQETLFSSSQNCTKILGELSSHLAKAYKSRNEFINQISSSSNSFRLAPRVTLTALKREAWLRDLANPDVPLHTISNRLPHGIRNKVLIDCMCNMNVPISRAIWFTKCVLYSEQMLLRKKIHARNSSIPGSSPSVHTSRSSEGIASALEVVEARWLQEWTSQIADYILKFSKDMPAVQTTERSAAYKSKLNYLIKLVQTLYVEFLLDRLTFLQTMISFLREDFPLQIEELPLLLEIANTEVGELSLALDSLLQRPLNFGQTLVTLTFVKFFWKDIIKEEFLSKQICESLLLNYFLIERVPSHNSSEESSSWQNEETRSGSLLLASLKTDLLKLIGSSVVELFLLNNNLFILPDYWILIGNVLYRILMNLPHSAKLEKDSTSIESTLQLIHFRNESLMLNMRHSYKQNPTQEKTKRRSSFLKNDTRPDKFAVIISQLSESELSSLSRSSDDNLRFIDLLDRLKLNKKLATLLIPTSTNTKWKVKVKILIYWCVTIYRDMGESCELIHIICNFLKRKIFQNMKGSTSFKTEFENEILESIFSLAYEPKETISMRNLFVLVNQLYQLKIVSMSSYLRKVIACGIFYLSTTEQSFSLQSDPQIEFHLALLLNLPALTNKQYFHIVKKWTSDVNTFSDSFERGIEATKINVLDSLTSGICSDDFDVFLKEMKAMNTGVKFLIINWLTPQIKSAISNSPKLIHIYPSTIANIFLFYSCMDNLTVFFKVFVKIILGNENKVLIYYLDTLYFISKLACHYYNLIKVIAGNTNGSASMAYEIFKLIIMNYLDISSRETDIFKFKDIWEFIDHSIGRGLKEENRGQNPGGFKKLTFNKDTLDSPLKIQTQSPRKNECFTVENFVSELNKLVQKEPKLLSQEDLTELLSENFCGLGLSLADVTQVNRSVETISVILKKWYALPTSASEAVDTAFYKLFEHSKRLLKLKSDQLLYDVFVAFITSVSEDGMNQVTIFLMKLLSYGTILHFNILALLDDVSNQDHSKGLGKICCNLVFNSSMAKDSLCNSQALLFQVLQAEYRDKYKESAFCLFIQYLKSTKLEFSENLDNCLKVTLLLMNTNKKFAFSFISQECPRLVTLFLCNRLLKQDVAHGAIISDSSDINDIDNVFEFCQNLSEFSLPIFQILLKTLTSDKRSSVSVLERVSLGLIDHLHFSFDKNNSYFGELFNFLDWESKEKIFFIFEDYFLSKLPSLDAHDERNAAMVPILKDFFEKISMSQTETLNVLLKTFRQLSQVLQALLQLVDREDVSENACIFDSLSIFLRLLIIHNSSLNDMIYSHDSVNFVFLRDLVKLYDSDYLIKSDEKLRILLYDLLLLFKNSLSQLSASNPNDILLEEASPTAIIEGKEGLDVLSSGRDSLEVPSTHNEVLCGRNLAAMVGSILNLPEPTSNNANLTGDTFGCSISLDDEELYRSSDISYVNNGCLVTSEREKVQNSVLRIVPNQKNTRAFSINNVKLIEDTSDGLNNGCVSLSLFEAYTTKENPY